MQRLISRWGKVANISLGLAVGIGALSPVLADVAHFANGSNIHGKLDRVTGDIIEFKRSNHFFGNLDYFKRIQLTDRHDVVETNDGSKYFGEIIYLDGFTLEIQTSSGAVRINRMELSGVVMGSPADQVNVPAMSPLPSQQLGPPEPEHAVTTISNTGNRKNGKPAASIYDANEDDDAIPAVDRGTRH